MSSQLQVTLEPFSGSGGGGGSGSGGLTLGSGGGFASASPLPHLQREQSLLNQLSGVQWNTPLPSPMDTSSAADYPAASPSASPSGSGSGKSKSDKSSSSGVDKDANPTAASSLAAIQSSISKDPKYLEHFLASIAHLPEFVKDKIGKIKGMEKAILMKSAALKEASAFHVQMIHLKLTPSKKDDSSNSASGGSGSGSGGNMSSPAFGSQQQSSSGNMQRNTSGSSPSLGGMYGGSSSGGAGSNLPPLPHPSPLPLPLPYSLTPALVQPLPTENLLNNLTYLLVGPVLHANAMLHGHPSLSGGSGAATGDKNNNSSSGSAGATTSSSSLSNLSRADLGVLPMNLSPSAVAPLGKKVSSSAASAASHPFASIPSPQELLSTSVTPILVDPPRAELSNELLDFRRRFAVPADYSLEAGEKIMREHIACIHEWSKAKNALVTDVYDQVDQLLKRADASLKKYEGKLRRGHFEVPATPIDRRRGPGAPTTLLAAATATTAAASSAATTAAGGSAGATAATAAPSVSDSRKRSHASLVQELEAREIQYQLQHELKSEIEKQSANALASANAGSAGSTVAGAGGAAGMGGMMAEANEPVYCTCKKVSFGAMVACDNEDCPTEWFHFACVGLDTKPRGKWLCADCRKKKKAKTAATAGK